MSRFLYIAIAVLLGLNNVFVNFRLGPISYDRLLEFALFFVFFTSFIKEMQRNSFFRGWVNYIIALALLQAFVNLKLALFNDIEVMQFVTSLVKCFSFIVFSFLFILILRKGVYYLNVLLFVHFLVCVFSLLGHPISPIASEMFEIKKFLFTTADQSSQTFQMENEYIEGGYADRFRLSGPFSDTVQFSYFAFTSFALNVYMYLRYKKKIYVIYLLLIFIASILTQTRSLLLAEIVLVFGYLFFLSDAERKFYKIKLIFMATLGIAFLWVSRQYEPGLSGTRVTTVSSDGKKDGRPYLWYTGIYAIAKNPFGISEQEYRKVKAEMYSSYGYPEILTMPSHNGLINIGFHYSALGYIFFTFYIYFLFKQTKELNKEYRLFFRMALLGYFCHIFFHNNFILIEDYFFLLVLLLMWHEKNLQNEIESKDIETNDWLKISTHYGKRKN